MLCSQLDAAKLNQGITIAFNTDCVDDPDADGDGYIDEFDAFPNDGLNGLTLMAMGRETIVILMMIMTAPWMPQTHSLSMQAKR